MTAALRFRLQAAAARYRAGHFLQAEALYREINALAPENAAVLERLGTLALWSNRTDEARVHLEAALRHTPWYRNIWPLNARRKYRLALAHYRQDRAAPAAALFRQAAGPLAIGPFKVLKAYGRQLALFADTTPYRVEGPEQSRIDFVATDPLPVIAVSVNAGERRHFILDTGGSDVILHPQLADAVGATRAGALAGPYAGGHRAETGLGRIDSLRLGEFVVRNLPIHTLNTDSISSLYKGLEIRGIIGTRLLMHFLPTLDYADAALVLRRTTAKTMQDLETQIATTKAKVIPFWLIDTHFMVAWGTVNHQRPMLFFVDTGLAGKEFTATEPVLQAGGIAADWSKAQTLYNLGAPMRATDILVERLTLGTGADEVVENDVPGRVTEGSVSILGDRLGFHIGGPISHQFFRRHALTFDFTRMRLIVR